MTTKLKKLIIIILCRFCDASTQACVAVIYLVIESDINREKKKFKLNSPPNFLAIQYDIRRLHSLKFTLVNKSHSQHSVAAVHCEGRHFLKLYACTHVVSFPGQIPRPNTPISGLGTIVCKLKHLSSYALLFCEACAHIGKLLQQTAHSQRSRYLMLKQKVILKMDAVCNFTYQEWPQPWLHATWKFVMMLCGDVHGKLLRGCPQKLARVSRCIFLSLSHAMMVSCQYTLVLFSVLQLFRSSGERLAFITF